MELRDGKLYAGDVEVQNPDFVIRALELQVVQEAAVEIANFRRELSRHFDRLTREIASVSEELEALKKRSGSLRGDDDVGGGAGSYGSLG